MIDGIRRDTDDTRDDGSILAVNVRWNIVGECRRRLGMSQIIGIGAGSMVRFKSVESGPYTVAVTPDGTLEAIAMTGESTINGAAYSPPVTTVGDVITVAPPVPQPIVTKPGASQLAPKTFTIVDTVSGLAEVVIPSVPEGTRNIYYVSGVIKLPGKNGEEYYGWGSADTGPQIFYKGGWALLCNGIPAAGSTASEGSAVRASTGSVYMFYLESISDVRIRFIPNLGPGIGSITLGIR